MKKAAAILSLLFSIHITHAQTKVFKEVSDGMAQQAQPIMQDGALVGYLTFTQLEQASADSFNYRISIMDENLNDIGEVKFKEQKLILQAVAFEQDMICLAYIKTNFIGLEWKTKKAFKNALAAARNSIFTQFINLSGKIVKGNVIPINIKMSDDYNLTRFATGSFKHSLQLRNISQKGFALFFGDESKNNLVVFNAQGKFMWQKLITEQADGFTMLTAGPEVYLLAKQKAHALEGGYELLSYSDSATYPKYALKDKKGNSLRVIDFDIDPVTSKPFITGTVINQKNEAKPITTANSLPNCYIGTYTLCFNGHQKGDIHEIYSYWDNGTNPVLNRRGRFNFNKGWNRFEDSWRDSEGNTYFVSSSFVRNFRWSTIVTVPLTGGLILIGGLQKVALKEAVVVKQDFKGNLVQDNTIKANFIKRMPAIERLSYYDHRNFHHVVNKDTKKDYLIIEDDMSAIIYDASNKKIVRTIPHYEKWKISRVYPAKEGHIMVSVYDGKEKTMRLSIESL